MRRYSGRSIIVHSGFPDEWFEELLKQPGGGGHFRLDARRVPEGEPTPIEWVVHEFVLPLGLPHPLFIQVREEALRVRHLTRYDMAMHPSEIAWILDELEQRYHAILYPDGGGFRVERGLPPEENSVETPYGFSL
ncbi:hypothetical protein HUS23_05240 [Ectothiorhodospiraceae bacterium 2226]|nr:hypothetical protein HUS23_05240 [Ectothiorhodospiraceae bacterium 2226]